MWYFYRYPAPSNLDVLFVNIEAVFNNIFANGNVTKNKICDDDFKEGIQELKLFTLLNALYDIYISLSQSEKEKLRYAFFANTQIEAICKGQVKPVSYDNLQDGASNELVNACKTLRELSAYLYDDFPKVDYFTKNIDGGFKRYYEKFHPDVIKYCCPFCGIESMLTANDIHRGSFDHYLYRGKYPFISFLKINLIPMCSTCNSQYKGQKDISDFERVFYPFGDDYGENQLKILGEKVEIINQGKATEIDSWDRIFDIKNRIKNWAELNKRGWLSCINEIKEGWSETDLIQYQIKCCKNDMMQSHNFIKKALFEEYYAAMKKD